MKYKALGSALLLFSMLGCGQNKIGTGITVYQEVGDNTGASKASGDSTSDASGDKNVKIVSGAESILEVVEPQGSPTPDASPTIESQNVTKTLVDSSSFRLKSTDQLKNSIESCLGKGRTSVLTQMLPKLASDTSTSTQNSDVGFLDNSFSPGSDIVTVQRDLFDGIEAELRSGVRPDQVSLAYLTGLKNVANVVAYNCDSSDAVECKCDSSDVAKDLLSRCLPDLNPNSSDFQLALAAFSTSCRYDHKAALASLIASYAFAKSP